MFCSYLLNVSIILDFAIYVIFFLLTADIATAPTSNIIPSTFTAAGHSNLLDHILHLAPPLIVAPFTPN